MLHWLSHVPELLRLGGSDLRHNDALRAQLVQSVWKSDVKLQLAT